MARRKFRNYAEGGASRDKPTLKTWVPNHYSAKTEIDANLQLLRSRAASLCKNSAVGAAAVNVMTSNVIGAGLKVFPRINHKALGVTAEYAREWSRRVKQEFDIWARSPLACDYLRRNNFFELQRVAFMSYLIDGDSFCLFRRRLPTQFYPYSLRLQLIEAGRVSNPMVDGGFAAVNSVEMKKLGGSNRIVNGIEVDAQGALVAIWISNRYWNEPTTLEPELKWQRVRWYGRDTGEKNILHICHDTRPDQFRGVPLLASVIEPLKQSSRYADAELTSAIIKSFFSIFFVQPLSNLEVNNILGEEDGRPIVDVAEYKLGPATMAALPRGVDVKAVDSTNAQSTFEAFTGAFLKQIGAAIGLPYEVLLKNFNASYSASRAALLQAADEFRVRRAAFVNDFCAPIYEQWLTESIALRRIPAPGFFDDAVKRAAWLNADWRNEQSHFLDPVKEMQGAQLQIALGLTTREKVAAEMCGVDFWENLEHLAEESRALSALTQETQEADNVQLGRLER